MLSSAAADLSCAQQSCGQSALWLLSALACVVLGCSFAFFECATTSFLLHRGSSAMLRVRMRSARKHGTAGPPYASSKTALLQWILRLQ